MAANPGGGQFDRERDTIEAAADSLDCFLMLSDVESVLQRGRAFGEEGDAGVLDAERLERNELFAGDSEGLSRRCEQAQTGALRAQRCCEGRCAADDMFAIVEDEQTRLLG
ncbi:MAG: hypothetical protein OEV40_20640 [Acidimicrobiia bacterium]|nr:hypothetical protein [Acidimicrobiia bacterium]